MAELSSYPAVTTLAGTERIPVITTPGIAGGNKYITADNLALFTGGGGGQPLDSDLTAIAALSTTAYGRALLELANAAAFTALSNIATETVRGTVEFATNAETVTGTDNTRATHPAGVAAAIAAGGSGGATTPEAYGAVRDGTTDDTTAFNAAQAALTAGGVVTLSKGTYKTKINPTMAGVTFKGAGMWATTLVPPAGTTWMIEWGAYAGNIAFEDVAFDFSALSTGHVALLSCVTTHNFRFTRCRFYNVPNTCAFAEGLSGLTVEGCLFHTPGNAQRSEGIRIGNGSRRIRFRDNTVLYCSGGIGGVTNCDDIHIHDNYFDQGWWLGASLATGTGGPVTYTATVLTDTGANFATLPTAGVGLFARTMATRRTNSGATVTYTYNSNLLVDTAASFITDGVMKGEIVRVGSIFGVVESVVSATTIQVEGWLSTTTYLPVTDPAAAAAYTVYKIVMGFIDSATATTLTTSRWHDLDGAASTPSAGTLYEVIPHGIYPIHLDPCKNVKVTNNTVKRGWADQISLFGHEAQVIGNTVEEGWDFGMTIHGANNIVMGNRVYHQGTVGITCGDDNGICVGNIVWGCQWTNPDNSNNQAGILIVGSNTVVVGNKVNGAGRAMSYYGIAVYAYPGNTLSGITLTGNISTGHATADMSFADPDTGTITDVLLGQNTATVIVDSTAGLVARSSGWAVSNVTTDKVFNANATSLDEIADVLGTLINWHISRGDLAA